jgi:hypothetical protein
MPLTRDELKTLNWRQLGFQLHEAMTGSNPNLYDYFALLCEVKRRVEEEMGGGSPDLPLDANPVVSDPDMRHGSNSDRDPDGDPPSPQATEVALPEKVIDLTHRGSGL